jgi:hypothetical protein
MSERVLTDEMIEEIKAYFPRYPTRQAVRLSALHVVNSRLRLARRAGEDAHSRFVALFFLCVSVCQIAREQ